MWRPGGIIVVVPPRSDPNRNPAGGLAVRFYGYTQRRAGADERELATPFDAEVVRKTLEALTNPELLPIDSGGITDLDQVLPLIVERPLRLVAQEHERCLDCDVSGWMQADEMLHEHLILEGFRGDLDPKIDAHVAVLTDLLAARTEQSFDFLCALVQSHDTRDFSSKAGKPASTYSNANVKQAVQDAVNEQLEAAGWRLVYGYPTTLTGAGATARPLDWPEVEQHLTNAQREITEGHNADALTDIGTALQAALTLAGCPGKTIGEQVAVAKKANLFTREHAKLGVAVEALGDWIASIRNQKGDAYPGAEASASEAHLAYGVLRAVVVYLLDQMTSPSGT